VGDGSLTHKCEFNLPLLSRQFALDTHRHEASRCVQSRVVLKCSFVARRTACAEGVASAAALHSDRTVGDHQQATRDRIEKAERTQAATRMRP
jgi:hypothetical protein